ncbi:MAG TPA: hypothetical protein VHN98_03085 [Acidimicrobiales bacterium]|nr:hypothetical protein [Acidimicrobiales bacterium]
MAVIETMTFRLAAGADEQAFREADARVQTEFAYSQRGLARRTTARGSSGEWIVIDLWYSEADADACDERWAADPVARSFMALVDPATVRTARYTTLD